MSIPYNFGIPNPPNNPSADVPLMQINANSIFNFVAIDHVGFNTAISSSGYHNVIHFSNQAADPGTIAGVGQLYTKTVTGDQNLFYESGLGKIYQLTNTNVTISATANGVTTLPGGLILQYGVIPIIPDTHTHTYNFNATANNITFPNNCFSIVLNPIRADNPGTFDGINIHSFNAASLTYQTTSNLNVTSATFIAIGN